MSRPHADADRGIGSCRAGGRVLRPAAVHSRPDGGSAAAIPAGTRHRYLQLHEMAGRGRKLRPFHLQRADARDQRRPRRAAHSGDLHLLDRLSCAARLDGGAARPASPLGRRGRSSPLRSGYRVGGTKLASARRRRLSLSSPSSASGTSAMVTLASIAMAVPLGVAGGLLLGILGLSQSACRTARSGRRSST